MSCWLDRFGVTSEPADANSRLNKATLQDPQSLSPSTGRNNDHAMVGRGGALDPPPGTGPLFGATASEPQTVLLLEDGDTAHPCSPYRHGGMTAPPATLPSPHTSPSPLSPSSLRRGGDGIADDGIADDGMAPGSLLLFDGHRSGTGAGGDADGDGGATSHPRITLLTQRRHSSSSGGSRSSFASHTGSAGGSPGSSHSSSARYSLSPERDRNHPRSRRRSRSGGGNTKTVSPAAMDAAAQQQESASPPWEGYPRARSHGKKKQAQAQRLGLRPHSHHSSHTGQGRGRGGGRGRGRGRGGRRAIGRKHQAGTSGRPAQVRPPRLAHKGTHSEPPTMWSRDFTLCVGSGVLWLASHACCCCCCCWWWCCCGVLFLSSRRRVCRNPCHSSQARASLCAILSTAAIAQCSTTTRRTHGVGA